MESNLHVVLGASGGAGNAIARALYSAGHRVRAVSRSGRGDLPADIEVVPADLTTRQGTDRATEGAAVVYMAAQPPYHRWPQEFPPMLETVVDSSAAAGAKLVMVDNLYCYGPLSGPITEITEEAADDRKGVVRREMAEMLLAAHESGKLRVTIGRASDYLGPGADNSSITILAIAPGIAGKPIRWIGGLDEPHSVAYLPDIARAFTILGTTDDADGRIWILPHAEPITGRTFLSLVNGALPDTVKTGLLSPPMLKMAAPFHKPSKEILDILHQWTEPFIVDGAGVFHQTFGRFETTPLERAVPETVEWYLRGNAGRSLGVDQLRRRG